MNYLAKMYVVNEDYDDLHKMKLRQSNSLEFD